MPSYLYLFRGGKRATTPAEMQASMQKWVAWMKDLKDKGHFKAGEPLEDAGKIVRGRKKAVTDGPFAEAKDLVGGYLLVSAKDIQEATELSKGCPLLEDDGVVEVRPIAAMPM